MKIFYTLLLISSFISIDAVAAPKKSIEYCEKKQMSNAELSQCLDKVKNAVDKELQTWINNQTFILEEFALSTGRKAALEMFQRSQRNFISYRENNCRWQYLSLSPSTGAAPAYKKCYILLSKDRINDLHRISK